MTGRIEDSFGSSNIRLAIDTDFPSAGLTQGAVHKQVNIDPSGALTEVFALSGKFAVSLLYITGLPTAEISTVKLTVDGEDKWNDTGITRTSANAFLWGSSSLFPAAPFIVLSSLSLKIETVADSSVDTFFHAHPIL